MTSRDFNQGDVEREREQALERVRKELEQAAAEARRLEKRHEALTNALAEVQDAARSRRAKVPLPLLAQVKIASPCHAKWDEMKGDDRVRHCASCDKDVYDLSEMTAAEAESLLAREGQAPCVRLHRRTDGTVITSDCPVGARKKTRRRWLAAGAAVAGSVLAAAGFAATSTTQGEPCVIPPTGPTQMMMGAIAVMPPPVTTTHENVSAQPTDDEVSVPEMGVPPAAPPPPVRMGRIHR